MSADPRVPYAITPALVITAETRDVLWAALQAEVKRIEAEHPTNRGTSRTVAMYHANGDACSVILKVTLDDGSRAVFHIQASVPNRVRSTDLPRIQIERWVDNCDSFWGGHFADRANAVVVNNTHYRIGRESDSAPPSRRGFAGRCHVIRFHDGREVTTTNLWYQGVIPPAWRDRLPDNASFVDPAGDS